MKIRERKREDIQINLTPLIDVVFLLLIFFMVSMIFKQNTQLDIELPSVAQNIPGTSTELELQIDAHGYYSCQEQRLDSKKAKDLRALLAPLTNDQSDMVIIGDKSAPLQSVVRALEVARDLDIAKVSVMANGTTGINSR